MLSFGVDQVMIAHNRLNELVVVESSEQGSPEEISPRIKVV